MKKILYIVLLLPVLAMAQSEDQNYVKTLIYRDTTNTLAPHASVTYYDGLGRPIQQVAGQMSASGMDIITHIEYDAYGRQVKKYLPYPTDRATLAFDSAAQTNTFTYYDNEFGDAYPYSESFLEPSPLGRVLKQSAPGAPWRGIPDDNTDKTIKFSQQVNTGTEVKYLKATATWRASTAVYEIEFSDEGYYGAGQLYKTVTKDENWVSGTAHTTEEFKNKEGQVVLKRTYINGVTADTYYVYDQFGKLTYVLPPKAQGSDMYLDNLCYQYKYDNRNRLAQKKLPGKQWEFIVYDSQDRVIATGPALTPFGGIETGWLTTYYDAFGRAAFTGYYKSLVNGTTRASLQGSNNGIPVYATRGSGTINNVPVDYTAPTGLPNGFRLLTVNYYDDYLWLPTADRPTASTQILNVNVRLNVKGMPTGGWVRVLEDPNTVLGETSFSYYDYKGRILRTKTKNYLGGYLQKDIAIDFDGTPFSTVTEFKRSSTDTALIIGEGFEYTEQDRLLSHNHNINSLPGEKLSSNVYNELGQLASKNVGGSLVLGSGLSTYQKVNYKYNIRGWLTDINDVNNLEAETVAPQDLFAFKINYNTIGDDLNGRISPLYNGNIAETQWISSQDNFLRKYSYKYDSASRLTDAYYQKPGQAVPEAGSYNESLLYDINGNVTSINRTGGLDDPNTVISIDALKLDYEEGSNQLKEVVDNSGSPQGFNDQAGGFNGIEYTYDANGNMLTDVNKYITNIKYNHLNLPVEIIFNNSSTRKINYLYNAAGVKVRKIVVDGSTTVTVDYLNGFQYKNAVLQFFPTAEGYVDFTRVNNSGTYNYVYQYKDHLGNVRMNYTYAAGKNGSPGDVKVKDESHYYPFGLKHLNYNMDYLEYQEIEDDIVLYPPLNTSAKLMYNYKYNGKELQDELGVNLYDYGARNYDPALGRWMNIDPLAETSRKWSPYTYCYNNPVYFIDPDGMSAVGEGMGQKPNSGISNDWDGIASADKQASAFRQSSYDLGGHYNSIEYRNYSSSYGKGTNTQTSSIVAGPVIAMGIFEAIESLTITVSASVATLTAGLGSIAFLAVGDTPDYSYTNYEASPFFGTYTIPEVKALTKDRWYEQNKGIDGSYTIIYENGKKYHGKGPIDRMMISAIFRMATGLAVKSLDWSPAVSAREAFKAEYRRMQTDKTKLIPEGYANPINYNIRQSPGKAYIQQDGF